MKRKKTRISLLGAAIIALAGTLADGIIERLGLQHAAVQQHILGNLAGDFATPGVTPEDTGGSPDGQSIDAQSKAFRIPSAKSWPAIASGDRRTAARELCAYLKDYVGSAAFDEAYRARRAAMQPTEEPPRLSVADLASKKAELKTLESHYGQLKGTGQLPATALKQFEDGIAHLRAFVAEQSDPTPNRTKWLEHYPENPLSAVKIRLQEYIALSATVDFDAKLTGAGKKQQFVDPAYEKQTLKWKAVYRAGREVNEEVRDFATQWLNELP